MNIALWLAECSSISMMTICYVVKFLASLPRALKGLTLAAQPGCELADIRDFFPSPDLTSAIPDVS
jgi:hypothetical protein